MINKFQQGGKQEQAIMKFVQAIAKVLKADPKQIVQIAQQNPNTIKVAAETFQQTQDINQAANAFAQEAQKSTQAARHGAKLNYVKSLKHQCADDEELVYYKKGGAVNCGCKKKEVGGKVQSAQNGAVAKFKNDKKTNQIKWTDKDEKKLDSLSTREGMNKPLTPQGKKDLKNLREKFKKSSNTKDYEVEEGKKGTKINKNCGGSAIAKFKAAKCGSKLKKHQQGGSLNGIPFMQKGSSFKKAWNIVPYKSNFSLPNEANVIVGPSLIQPGLLPEVTIMRPDRRLRFDRRENNIGGGRKVISEALYDYYNGGDRWLGDLATIPAGRVIYTSPYRNDTLYYNKNVKFIPGKGWTQTGNSRYLEYPHGYMQVADKNDPQSKKVWKYLIKNKNILPGIEPGEEEAFNRAKKEK